LIECCVDSTLAWPDEKSQETIQREQEQQHNDQHNRPMSLLFAIPDTVRQIHVGWHIQHQEPDEYRPPKLEQQDSNWSGQIKRIMDCLMGCHKCNRLDQCSLTTAPTTSAPAEAIMALIPATSLTRVWFLRTVINAPRARAATAWKSEAVCAGGVSNRITS